MISIKTKIRIRNRRDVEEISKSGFPANTALISITDYNYEFADLQHRPDYLLQLAFDDVDNDIFLDELGRQPTDEERCSIAEKYHMLSDKQAIQIAQFYNAIKNKVDIIICQCEHGQSRSAAVAAAILEHRSRGGIKVFANDKYYPNKAVFNKVLQALKAIAR